jgi:hypothetical protein
MLLLAAALIGAAPALAPKPTGSDCPKTTSYLADASGLYRGPRLRPRKLTELPPGTAYMAVYRRIGRCEAPLTMSDYLTRH